MPHLTEQYDVNVHPRDIKIVVEYENVPPLSSVSATCGGLWTGKTTNHNGGCQMSAFVVTYQ